MEGWIKLHRGAKNHWVFKDPEAWMIWCYILMDVTHRQSQRRVRGRTVQLYAGQTIFGRPEWEKILNINGSKIYRVIQQFVDANMITLLSVGRHYSVITVCNWSAYQTEYGEHQSGQETEQQSGQETEQPQDIQPQDIQQDNGQQDKQQNSIQKDNKRTYNKNVKNANNNNKNISSKKFDDDSVEYQIAFELRKYIIANNSNAKVPTEQGLQRWAIDIDRMLRIDNRSPDDIKTVIEYSQKNDFWKSNILSTAKLREKFDTLLLQSKGKKSSNFKNGKPPQAQNYSQRKYDDGYYENLYE